MVANQDVKPNLVAVKTKQQAAWADGNYSRIGRTLTIMAEQLCEAADLRAGSRVLDVATGSGIVAFAAARRGCDVTAIDYVPSLLQEGKNEGAATGLIVDFQDGDAEQLSLPDASFDAVLSNVGVMFTPDQAAAARELVRVCRPGGTIGLANWTPGGFVGEMFKTIGRYIPPPAGVPSPMTWGTEQGLRDLFGTGISSITITRQTYNFRYRSAADWLNTFATYYGPMLRAFAALDDTQRSGLAADLLELAERRNTDPSALRVPGEYLQVIATRR